MIPYVYTINHFIVVKYVAGFPCLEHWMTQNTEPILVWCEYRASKFHDLWVPVKITKTDATEKELAIRYAGKKDWLYNSYMYTCTQILESRNGKLVKF